MKNYILPAIVLIAVAGLIFFFGYSIGNLKGMDKAWELTRKWECESKFSYKPLVEITGNCLKYFQ